MSALLLVSIYGLAITIASLIGGWLPEWLAITHKRMQITLSFVGGMMLGIALLYMLPHAILETQSLDQAMIATLIGLLFMFFLIRLFHFHQHAPDSSHEDEHSDCEHDHSHHHHHEQGNVHGLSWAGVATGMGVHTFIDGLALGTAVIADQHHAAGIWGIGVFLAIVCHQPLDSLSIVSLMRAGGWPSSARHLVNLGFALLCPLGAILAVLSLQSITAEERYYVGWMMGFAAGIFICISLGDLLPEVQFHSHDRVQLSAALLLGIAAAVGVMFLDRAAHNHDHSIPQTSDSASPTEIRLPILQRYLR